MTEVKAADLPESVSAEARNRGHDLKPMAGAYDETHDCSRCGARAYPMPGRRTEWMGWALDYGCEQVRTINEGGR